MKAKLIIDNKDIEIEISHSELVKLLTPSKKTGYERANCTGDTYWHDDCGQLHCDNDSFSFIFNRLYENANYYTSKEIAENNIRADRLMRQLRRFAVEHRKNPLNWEEIHSQRKYFICYRTSDIFDDAELKIKGCWEDKYFGGIYFDTQEAAQEAIKIFHDELLWYFTEYKDSL